MGDIIKVFTNDVRELEEKFEALDMTDKKAIKSFEPIVLELLARLKRQQDTPGNEGIEDDFEDLIYRVILILGQLDLLEF